MAVNTNPSSRRALLAGTAAGLAVAAADRLARPLSARAADGATMLVGRLNSSSNPTVLESDETNREEVLWVKGVGANGVFAHSKSKCGLLAESETHHGIEAHTAGSEGFGVYGISVPFIGVRGEGGQTGVHGSSDAGDGVRGISPHGIGVAASSDTGWGMLATSVSGTGIGGVSVLNSGVEGTSDAVGAADEVAGVYGRSTEPGHDKPGSGPLGSGTGVLGRSGTGVGVKGESAAVGVEGRTKGTTTEEGMFQADVIGVWGRVDDPPGFGIAVKGDGANGCGVLGQGGHCGVHGYSEKAGVEGKSLAGTGVSGQTNEGVAVSAEVFPGGSGVALIAHGPVIFDSAGRGDLVGGRARVTPGVALYGDSQVLITLMGNPGAQALVPYVEVSPGPAGTGFFRVRVPGARATAIPFAYFVIG